MNGHPATAFLVAQHLREGGIGGGPRRRPALRRRSRSVRLGRYRLTLTKEVGNVPGTM